MEVAKLFAQVSHQVEVHEGKKIWSMRWTRGYAFSSLYQHDFGIECSNDPFVKVKKLIDPRSDLEATAKISQKGW